MKRKMVQVEQVWMNGEELAKALDLSPGRVSQLAAIGVFEKEKDGYELRVQRDFVFEIYPSAAFVRAAVVTSRCWH